MRWVVDPRRRMIEYAADYGENSSNGDARWERDGEEMIYKTVNEEDMWRG